MTDWRGMLLLFAMQRIVGADEKASTIKWDEPELNSGPFPFKGQGWIPQE